MEKADGKTVEEKRYYISSLLVDVELFSKSARGHWGVENQLHWHLDFTLKDDYNTTTKTCAKNMQMLKKIALAVLHIVQALYSQSLKRIRKTIARDCEKNWKIYCQHYIKHQTKKTGNKNPLLVITFYVVIRKKWFCS